MNDDITAQLCGKIPTLALNKMVVITFQCMGFSTELCSVTDLGFLKGISESWYS